MAKANRKEKADANQQSFAADEQAILAACGLAPQAVVLALVQDEPNGNVAPLPGMESVPASADKAPASRTSLVFDKVSQRFAHMKAGCQKRFQRKYSEVAGEVRTAWALDNETRLAEFAKIAKFNVALAETKQKRMTDMAKSAARDIINTVFSEWRAEMDRIVTVLHGHPQDDGNILFPDGTTGRMPKGLWIDPSERLQLS